MKKKKRQSTKMLHAIKNDLDQFFVSYEETNDGTGDILFKFDGEPKFTSTPLHEMKFMASCLDNSIVGRKHTVVSISKELTTTKKPPTERGGYIQYNNDN